MAIVCEQCGLKNPNSAVMCDCGLLLAPDADRKTIEGAERAHYQRRGNVAAPIAIGVGVLVLLLVLRLVIKLL